MKCVLQGPEKEEEEKDKGRTARRTHKDTNKLKWRWRSGGKWEEVIMIGWGVVEGWRELY